MIQYKTCTVQPETFAEIENFAEKTVAWALLCEKFADRTFAEGSSTVKFAKVFTCESFWQCILYLVHLSCVKAVRPASHWGNMEGRMKNDEEKSFPIHTMSSPHSSVEVSVYHMLCTYECISLSVRTMYITCCVRVYITCHDTHL